jgi:hypothetical protein
MINAARTLLLNRSGASRPAASYFLEEYVDPDYRPLVLPSYLKNTYNALIGASDDAYANFRLWQYMSILHSTEFAEYVTALDPRVTYRHVRSVIDTAFNPAYEALTVPANGLTLYFIGSIEPNLSTPRLYNSWLLETGGASLIRVTNLALSRFSDETVTFSSGLSSPIPMVGENDFFVRIASDPLPAGANWLITVFSKPVGDLSELETALKAVSITEAFFPHKEPFITFKKLWQFHPFLQYRLSGFLLAHIYGVEGVRLNGQ